MKEFIKKEGELIKLFGKAEGEFLTGILKILLGWLMVIKDEAAKLMYQQRGRFSQSFVNVVMALIFFGVMVFSGKLEELINKKISSQAVGSGYLLASNNKIGAETLISNLPKGEVTEYRVQDGDTVSGIAVKFGVSMDTIIWENNLKSVDAIKPQQILRILPVTGVRYQVSRGETIYSIAKKLQADAQTIIDYPFNTFSNDETFALVAGQDLIVPDGIKPNEITVDTQKLATKTVAPIPGVVGEGNFMWPTSGIITQRFSWYHPAIDIANHDNPPIVAAASGTVITAGWNGGGYGNYVVIDHGNGYQTLYGHMLNNSIIVKAGDRVTQGQRLGTMGSTGRSTGTHCHFEIILTNGGRIDPLSKLK
jgi:murein DD-endopeptidase MepM/ murein hydrolase activator NlpD